MLTGPLSELVETIERAAVPKWLSDYVRQNENHIRFDLECFGKHIIPIPIGGKIIIERETPEAQQDGPRRVTRPNCF